MKMKNHFMEIKSLVDKQFEKLTCILLNHNYCLSTVKVRCIGMLSPTQLLYIVCG